MAVSEAEPSSRENLDRTTSPSFLFSPLRQWIDQLPISNELQANRLCRLIPAQCPFERDIKILGRTVFHMPPLCKLNPVYTEIVALRWRALCYLADECGRDVSKYC
jgi:hypothetical protein